MGITIRTVVFCAAWALAGLCNAQAGSTSSGQAWPGKPVRFIAPFAPGGPVDIIARLLGLKLTESLGHQIIIDNRAGAGGNIGTAAVAKSAPDGYTTLITSSAFAVNVSLFPDAGYSAERDFIPTVIVASQPNLIFVNANYPPKTLVELLSLAKSTETAFASPGSGTTPHLTGENLFNVVAKLGMTPIHFRGAGPAVTAVVSGEPAIGSMAISGPLPHIKSGRLRELAVSSARRVRALPALLLVLAFCVLHSAFAQAPAKAALHLVFVMDGLRPDGITASETPILFRLGNEGVIFENSHSVFPTVTRVNSASLSTGMQPAHHGIMGNQIYIPAVDPVNAFSNDNFLPLLKLGELTDGRIVRTPSIAELTTEIGPRYVAVSSGSTGSALLMAPRAPRGSGAVINANFYGAAIVGWPETVSKEVLKRFGPQPKTGGARDNFNTAVDWSMTVLREYVLPELKPSVAYVWVTEPDHIQHAFGAGAPESLVSIRNNDRNLGLVLEALDKLGLRARTNIMIVSDHGFSQTVYGVNVRQELLDAGFKADDGRSASSGRIVAPRGKGRAPA